MNLARTTMLMLGGLSLLIALAVALLLHVDSVTSLVLYGIAAIMGLSMLFAVAYPCVVVYFKERLAHELVVSAKRHAVISIFVVLVILCRVLGISLMQHSANVLVVMSALVCGFALTLFSFKLNLKLFHVPIVGVLAVIGWFLMVFSLFISLIDSSPRTVAIGDNMICSQYDWGWGGSDSGSTLKIFKRYLVIDRQVDIRTEDYTSSSAEPPERTESIQRCEAAFSRMINVPQD